MPLIYLDRFPPPDRAFFRCVPPPYPPPQETLFAVLCDRSSTVALCVRPSSSSPISSFQFRLCFLVFSDRFNIINPLLLWPNFFYGPIFSVISTFLSGSHLLHNSSFVISSWEMRGGLRTTQSVLNSCWTSGSSTPLSFAGSLEMRSLVTQVLSSHSSSPSGTRRSRERGVPLFLIPFPPSVLPSCLRFHHSLQFFEFESSP